MEPFRSIEALGDQRGADDAPLLADQRSARLVGEDRSGKPGEGERHDDAEQDGESAEEDERGAKQGDHGQTIPARVRSRSISLMPRNGATMPPRPNTSRFRRRRAAAPTGA